MQLMSVLYSLRFVVKKCEKLSVSDLYFGDLFGSKEPGFL